MLMKRRCFVLLLLLLLFTHPLFWTEREREREGERIGFD
jgi:hypothetical protein